MSWIIHSIILTPAIQWSLSLHLNPFHNNEEIFTRITSLFQHHRDAWWSSDGRLEIEVFDESFKFKLKLKGNEGEEFEKLLLIWLIDWGGLAEEIIFKTSKETSESPSGENSS